MRKKGLLGVLLGVALSVSFGAAWAKHAGGMQGGDHALRIDVPVKLEQGHVVVDVGHLVTDRNRADLDWSRGRYTWRYRNRFTAERPITIRSYHPGPYASAEVFYEGQYSKWASTRLFGGCLLPLSTYLQLDPYYEHVNNTGKHPNQQVNAGGLILSLYFPANTH
jgi:hypothetical protein